MRKMIEKETARMKAKKRMLAVLLSATMLFSLIIPVGAAAENTNTPPQDGAIASFEPLDSGVAEQTVTPGTAREALDLPDTLTAAVYRVSADILVTEDGTPENDAEPEVDSGKTATTVTTTEEQIPVTWNSTPAYDDDTLDKYVFTADVGGCSLSDGVEPPQITVTVMDKDTETSADNQPGEPGLCTKTEGCTLVDGHDGACEPAPQADNSLVKTIVNWTFVGDDYLNMGELPMSGVTADNQASFDDVAAMLPTAISAEFEGGTDPVTVDISGWICDAFRQDGGNWPVAGEYLFTAALPEGYVCDPLPSVRVLPGGADTIEVNSCVKGDFVIEGADLIDSQNGGDFYLDGEVLKITSGKPMTIRMRDDVASTADYRLAVADNTAASLTLDNVHIDCSSTGSTAFDINNGSSATLILRNENTFTGGVRCAGIQVPDGAAVTIEGSGKLNAMGGNSYKSGDGGAGIGGSAEGSGGEITIQGSVQVAAMGGDGGAGIGGGQLGSGGKITIQGSAQVVATGSDGGAGIGGGTGIGDPDSGHTEGGDGGEISIRGSARVTAMSSGYRGHGAGIGGGWFGSGGTVIISGEGASVTASSTDGCDVGSGKYGKSGGSLSVTDGAMLEMEHNGTDAPNPTYQNCTILDCKNGIGKQYDGAGNPTETLTLWNGSTNASAKGLGVQSGGTIFIRGNGDATLTIDVDDVTVTSGGRAVNGSNIRVASSVRSLIIQDLDLTARDMEFALYFASDATLTVEGTCFLTGGSGNSDMGKTAIYCNGNLTVEVGNAFLTAVGGACTSTFSGGHGIFAASLIVSVGNGGSLTATGGNSGGSGGSGLSGDDITIHNGGTIVVESGKTGGGLSRYSISSGGNVTLDGAGTTTARGNNGIKSGGVLTVDGAVTAEGLYTGVLFQNGSSYKLAGSGSLTAKGLYGTAWSDGMRVLGDLELAFTGSLTVQGGKGTEGHGMCVFGDLTVSAAPVSMNLRSCEGTDGYALSYANLVNDSSIPDAVFVKNGTAPVAWPADMVTYTAPDKDSGDVPSDSAYYGKGMDVTVLGNTGSLTRSGYVFAGWAYDGTTYMPGETLTMPDHEIILTAVWTAMGQTAMPTADPKGGAYREAQTVTLACATPGATIYYMLDDSDPTTSGTWQPYSAPITVPLGSTLKAYAGSPDSIDSSVMTETYTKQADGDPSPTYFYRTLYDPDTGIKVSGSFTGDAVLAVKKNGLHEKGACEVCDGIRERQDKGELLVLFDIGLSSGKYTGDLDVEIPVDARYNGQEVEMFHCKDKVEERRTVTVENGMAKGTFSGLSPFAVAVQPHAAAVITGLPDSHTLQVGQSVSWTPAPAGGAWSYDKALLSMTENGDTYTFKALKTGMVTATYTFDGVPFTVTITINDSTIPQTDETTTPQTDETTTPQTGDTTTPQTGGTTTPQTDDTTTPQTGDTTMMLVSLAGVMVLFVYLKKTHYKKRHR